MAKNQLDKRLKALKRQRKTGDLYSGIPVKKKGKKGKEPKVSNKAIYIAKLTRFQFHIYDMICEINGLPLDYYVVTDSTGRCQLLKTFKIDDNFKKLSKLKWGEPSPIDGLYFRGRFATILLMKVVRRSHKVIKSICQETEDSGFKYKKAIRLIESWMKIVDTFIAAYLSANADYQPYLFKIEELLMVQDDIDSKKLFTHIVETEDMMRKGIEPGLIANNVTKVAYILSTHGTRTKKCPKYDEDYKYDDNHLVANQIGELGYAVIKYRRKHPDEKLPPLYSAFQDANPQIYSRFGGKTDDMPEMVVGLKVLEFSKIFYNDRTRIDDLIGKLM